MNNDQISMLLAYMIQSQSSGGFVQNFLFPFLLSAMSAMIGAYAAYYLLNKREQDFEQKGNLNSLNFLSLNAVSSFNQLMALKFNYFEKINSNPFQRAASIPPFLDDFEEFDISLETISLLIKAQKCNQEFKWAQPWHLLVLIKHHRALISTWKKRNEVNLDCRTIMLEREAVARLTDDQIIESIPKGNLVQWIDFTERSLMLTDDLLIQLSSLIKELPAITGEIVPPKILKKYNKLKWDLDNVHENIIARVPEVDYARLMDLFEMSEEELKHRFRSTI